MASEVQNFNRGEGLKSMVYGGLDGIITTFAVVAGAIGGDLNMEVILILGFANLLADGISMAIGDYLSSKSERAYDDFERLEIAKILEKDPELNQTHIQEVYENKGLSSQQAQIIAEKLVQHDVDTQMKVLSVGEEEASQPLTNACITFFSFAFFGLFPLIIFILAYFNEDFVPYSFSISILMTFVTLFILGVSKASVTKENSFKSGMEMLVIGGLAALAAYGIGSILASI
ncbi:VIT1/CCC1 transporter family protein [Aerococcus sanguinicola]|uniref:VIT family protein n=1 Tax=Aerococcus sanguinicola TaxID=119206 RepID=A0A0X8FCF1_9LACT|nr:MULTISPECIES: VIT1/CCC1 transporter family protein [Aerococcus]AMB94784.1 hypothetical protein AWM72_08450 [Aerococcus sanguinicola]MDK7049553.1 VIT1/CCC1 transporter family protein [Aerococcus sanguinicola]OFT96328.1 hypothetical protein HMPREF3090_02780 [Aerococcus sp. HMSC23C02]PKZ23215.1 hypothetical protein CYJ28_01305 [Aerococcus sanguinicola]